MISSIKANLLAGGDNLIFKLQNNLRDFYSIKDLKLGYSIFDNLNLKFVKLLLKNLIVLFLNNTEEIKLQHSYFCKGIMEKVFINHETFIISDVDEYG